MKFFWHSRRESNPELALRRGLLYPFNYGSLLFNFLYESGQVLRRKKLLPQLRYYNTPLKIVQAYEQRVGVVEKSY